VDVTKNASGTAKAVPKKKSKGLKKFLDSWQLLVLFLPCFVYYVMFAYVPMWGIAFSFMDYKPFLGLAGSKWVGFEHYQMFFSDPNSWTLVKNTFLISFYDLLFSFPFTIIFALIVNEIKQEKLKKAFQTVTYMPHFISTVVIVGILKSLLDPSNGMIMNVLMNFGFPKIDLFAYSEYFRPMYILSGIWQGTGWGAIIYYAALSNIDQELYEAAVIDGANKFQQIIHITIPSIIPTIVTLFILRTGSLLSVGFEKAYLMQTTANLSTSDVISTYVYRQGLAGSRFSYATAVGMFNSVINLAFLLISNYGSKKLTENSLW